MEIIQALSIKNGDDFEIWLDDSQIIMRKLK